MIFYSTHLKLKTLHADEVAGNIFKLFILSFRFIKRREGYVVFDIDSKTDSYLYIIRRKLGKSGRIISFESRPYLLHQRALCKKFSGGKMLNWNR